MGVRADFFLGIGPNAEWLGSISWDGDPTLHGEGPFSAATRFEFVDAVEALLGSEGLLPTRPSEGWPWPWNDLRGTDFAYAWDPERGALATSFGREWVTRHEWLRDPECIDKGRKLLDEEVEDMSPRAMSPEGMLAKSGLLFG